MEVEGIILIISCQKHKENRLKEFKLSKNEYNGWKVIYVLGDLSLETPYKFENNFLTIKCEDSYIHLLKKVVLAIEILQNNFSIKQGILRCGDDLIFNENKLVEFLNLPDKSDYMGANKNTNYNFGEEITWGYNYFMPAYYRNHPEDFTNPLHNLQGVNILDYVKIPYMHYCTGVVFYLSNKACRVIVDQLKSINYNIFYEDPKIKCFPYVIEDVGIGFILYNARIKSVEYPTHSEENNLDCIALHTNKYR